MNFLRPFKVFTFSNSDGVYKTVVADWCEREAVGGMDRPKARAEFPTSQRFSAEEQHALATQLCEALNKQRAAQAAVKLEI